MYVSFIFVFLLLDNSRWKFQIRRCRLRYVRRGIRETFHWVYALEIAKDCIKLSLSGAFKLDHFQPGKLIMLHNLSSCLLHVVGYLIFYYPSEEETRKGSEGFKWGRCFIRKWMIYTKCNLSQIFPPSPPHWQQKYSVRHKCLLCDPASWLPLASRGMRVHRTYNIPFWWTLYCSTALQAFILI